MWATTPQPMRTTRGIRMHEREVINLRKCPVPFGRNQAIWGHHWGHFFPLRPESPAFPVITGCIAVPATSTFLFASVRPRPEEPRKIGMFQRHSGRGRSTAFAGAAFAPIAGTGCAKCSLLAGWPDAACFGPLSGPALGASSRGQHSGPRSRASDEMAAQGFPAWPSRNAV